MDSCSQKSLTDITSHRPMTEAEMRKIFDDSCVRVNAFYRAEGFPILAPAPETTRFKLAFNANYQAEIGVFDPTDEALVSCNILAASGRVIEFHNYAAAHAYQRSPKYAVRPPAKWTEAHAVEIATKFAEIFTKDWGETLRKPEAYYRWVMADVDNTTGGVIAAPGQWTVSWAQQTPGGILYRTGGVSVQLSERYGPQAIYINFPAHYEDEHITPLDRDKAQIEAHKWLVKILRWEPAQGWLSGAQIQGEPESSLMIVQPNDLTTKKSTTDAALTNQLKARLAWVISYKVVNPANPAINGNVSVYIDAEDGSFLGGYF